jgi:hypothetical protein
MIAETLETLGPKIQTSSIFNLKVAGDALDQAVPVCEENRPNAQGKVLKLA